MLHPFASSLHSRCIIDCWADDVVSFPGSFADLVNASLRLSGESFLNPTSPGVELILKEIWDAFRKSLPSQRLLCTMAHVGYVSARAFSEGGLLEYPERTDFGLISLTLASLPLVVLLKDVHAPTSYFGMTDKQARVIAAYMAAKLCPTLMAWKAMMASDDKRSYGLKLARRDVCPLEGVWGLLDAAGA